MSVKGAALGANLDLPEGGVDIDGAILEGGGQILRIASALAAVTAKPVRVRNIRANRSKPGLRPQHLAGLELVARICGGELRGGHVGSSTITLVPGSLRSGSFQADPGTAGSCCLLAQAALPPLLFASATQPSRLRLRGGTDADLAPPYGYLQQILLPSLRRLWGIQIEDQLSCRGFFPKGGGTMELGVSPLTRGETLRPVHLDNRGVVTRVWIEAFTAGNLKPVIAECMAKSASKILRKELGKSVVVSESVEHYGRDTSPAALGEGAGILVAAETDTGCVLGSAAPSQRGVAAEDIAAKAATELLEDLAHGGCADRWLEDQLIVFMALADSESESTMTCGEPSLHTRTAMVVAEKMLGAVFKVERPKNGASCHTIRCRGAGVLATLSQ